MQGTSKKELRLRREFALPSVDSEVVKSLKTINEWMLPHRALAIEHEKCLASGGEEDGRWILGQS